MAPKKFKAPPKVTSRHPLGYENENDFVKSAVTLFQKDIAADRHNLEPAREDIKFVIGDQWNPDVRLKRDRMKKPVLTVNRLPAFVAQYIGSWLQSDLAIKLTPARGGTRQIAEIRQGIIRTIQRTRPAKQALFKAMETAYICGIGNFSVDLADTEYDVFQRDIVFKQHADPFAVIWDRASKEPTGADAQHVFVFEDMTLDDFKAAYPESSSTSGWPSEDLDSTAITGHGWDTDEMVRVCTFWQMKKEPVTLGLEAGSGDVIDITDMSPDEYIPLLEPDDNGDPIMRETFRPYAEAYVMNGTQVLEGPFRLDIPRLPVFRVEGWSLEEASVRFRWGFVRNAKDPQRLHNFWRSVLAEELSRSVSSKWLLDAAAMKNGLADRFRNAHLSGDNVLFWDSQSDGAKPENIDPPRANQAVLTEAGMTVQDIKDVTNKHEASFGIQSNEVSGKAITARQRVSELGDVIYIENMNAAMAEAGRVINALIPVVYDTNRTVKITGDDDVELLQEINGADKDATPDVTVGKYDITYATGPSYATKRQESVDVMMTLMNTMPQVGNVIADIIVRNMDIPGASEIEARLASLLPPGMIDPDKLPAYQQEQVKARLDAQQKASQQQEAIQTATVQKQLEKLAAEILELQSRAAKQGAQAQAEESRIGVDALEAEIKADKNEIDAAKVGVSIDTMGANMVRMGLDAYHREADAEAAAAAQQTSQAGTEPAAPA